MEYLTVKQVAELTSKNEETIRRKIRMAQNSGADQADTICASKLTSNKKGYLIPVSDLIEKNIITKEEAEAYIQKIRARRMAGVFNTEELARNTELPLLEMTLQMDELNNKKLALINELTEKKQAVIKTEAEIAAVDFEIKRIMEVVQGFKQTVGARGL